MKLLVPAAAVAAAATLAATGGCAHLTDGVPSSVTPTPSVTSTPSQAPCNLTAAPGAQIVAVSPLITPVTDPVYGVIGGYGLVAGGVVSNIAAPIVVSPPTTIQFFDNDQSGSPLRYSAVGIPNVTQFPAPSYAFPPAAAQAPIGSTISATATWSTGLLGGQCYSQPLSVATPGTYFFGDFTYYGLANLRDVIVATATPR